MTFNAVVFLLLALLPLFQCNDDIAFFPENGHYYQVIALDKGVTFNDAKTLAAARSHNSKQGYVVTIGSPTEQAFLQSYVNSVSIMPTTGGDWPTIWGGAQMSGGQWSWNALGRISSPFFDANKLTCYNYGYCNWNVSMTSASFPPSLYCLQIFLNNTNGPTPGTWRPASCSLTSQSIVVEYDASQNCGAGYVYRTSKGWCEDVNECANNANLCGAGYQCVNTIGSYECADINECLNKTICNAGYQCVNGNGSYSCVDINECAQTPSVCQAGYDCNNLVGSYQCTDINECSSNSTLCKKGYTCQNTPGSYACNDINECTQSANTPCPFGTRCSNTIGSYTCDSIYFFIQSAWNGLVLDFKIVNGIRRLITNNWDPRNVTNQLWSFTPEGFIINAQNGYVVDAENGLVYPGVFAILWPQKRIEEAVNQLWSYDSNTDYWASKDYNVVLDIFQAKYEAGAEICLFTPKATGDTPQGNLNQRWEVIESALKS